MPDTFTRLHGTTVDRFKVGQHSQKVTLTGITESTGTISLFDRDGNSFVATSTVFFTAYVIGKGVNTAAFEVKGCYVAGTSTVTGYVVNTYVDTANFQEPVFSFDESGLLTVTCTGVDGETVNWTAVVDIVSI